MKRIALYIFIVALALVSPFFMSGIVFNNTASADIVTQKLGGEEGQEISLSGNNVLENNLTIETTHTPIGSFSQPFTGEFDGNGKTITLIGNTFERTQYQGIFGYAKGAKIKNVKIICEDFTIDASFDNDGLISEYFIGILLGYGDNVAIENCEVEGNIIAEKTVENVDGKEVILTNNIESKLTFGGLVGAVKNISTISNVGTYVDVDFDCDLKQTYTLKIGGMVGQLADSSSMKYCVGYNNFVVSNVSSSVNLQVEQGGLVGNINGSNTTMRNCAVTSTFDTTHLKIDDKKYTGGLIGSITTVIPESGNIASCGYHYTLNSTTLEKFYGNHEEVKYNFKSDLNDDVKNISAGYMMNENFFTRHDKKEDYGFEWYGLLEDWDFELIWIIVQDEAKLQTFQNFEIKLIDQQLDERHNTLVDMTDYSDRPIDTKETEDTSDDEYDFNYNYSTKITYTIVFRDYDTTEKGYEGYYRISDIRKDGNTIGYSSFTQPAGESVNANPKTLLSSDGNYTMVINYDSVENKTTYTFTIVANYYTRGTYTFITEEIYYKGYALAENGGLVKNTSSSSSPKEQLDSRDLSKDKEWNIKAVPNYQYAFATWTLWEEISSEVYVANSEKTTEYFKYERENEPTTYWHLIQDTLSENVELITLMRAAEFSVTFGQAPFNKNFLLKATFEKKVYAFNIKDLDVSTVNRVEVVNKLNESFVFDGNSTNSDFVELDQNETIILNLYLKSGYEIEEDSLPEQLKANYEGKSEVDLNGEKTTCFRYRVSTSNFKELINNQNQFSLTLVTKASGDNENGGMPLWLIIVIIAGGLLVVAVVIIIIVKVSRRGGGGKAKRTKIDSDYKKLFN